jgi:hypothetical protein
MQAQASGGGSGSGGGGLKEVLQRPPVLIGIAVATVLAVIALVWILMPKGDSSSGTTPTAGAKVTIDANGPGGGSNGTSMADSSVPTTPTAPTGVATTATAAGATPAAGTSETVKPGKPGVPVRSNPFRPNRELVRVLNSIRGYEDVAISPMQPIWAEELHTPKPDQGVTTDPNDGPANPPMRVSGIVHGDQQIAAIIQIGSEFFSATPGKYLPDQNNPVYRVERIENGGALLTRRWEDGLGKKHTQRIQVPLSGGVGGASMSPVTPATGGPAGSPIPGGALLAQ